MLPGPPLLLFRRNTGRPIAAISTRVMETRVSNSGMTPLGLDTVFGAPMDVTLAELAIEAFYPADETTAAAMRAAHSARKAAEPA